MRKARPLVRVCVQRPAKESPVKTDEADEDEEDEGDEEDEEDEEEQSSKVTANLLSKIYCACPLSADGQASGDPPS